MIKNKLCAFITSINMAYGTRYLWWNWNWAGKSIDIFCGKKNVEKNINIFVLADRLRANWKSEETEQEQD